MELHTRTTDLHAPLAEERGDVEPPTGSPSWGGTARRTSPPAFSTPDGQAAANELLEDDRNFVDLPSSPIWLGEEKVVIG